MLSNQPNFEDLDNAWKCASFSHGSRVAKVRDALFDEIEKQNISDLSNGSGVGSIDGQVGIVIYIATDKDKANMIHQLEQHGILTKTRGGFSHEFKGVKVGFEVIGRIELERD